MSGREFHFRAALGSRAALLLVGSVVNQATWCARRNSPTTQTKPTSKRSHPQPRQLPRENQRSAKVSSQARRRRVRARRLPALRLRVARVRAKPGFARSPWGGRRPRAGLFWLFGPAETGRRPRPALCLRSVCGRSGARSFWSGPPGIRFRLGFPPNPAARENRSDPRANARQSRRRRDAENPRTARQGWEQAVKIPDRWGNLPSGINFPKVRGGASPGEGGKENALSVRNAPPPGFSPPTQGSETRERT